jgi:hypothetical protein
MWMFLLYVISGICHNGDEICMNGWVYEPFAMQAHLNIATCVSDSVWIFMWVGVETLLFSSVYAAFYLLSLVKYDQ